MIVRDPTDPRPHRRHPNCVRLVLSWPKGSLYDFADALLSPRGSSHGCVWALLVWRPTGCDRPHWTTLRVDAWPPGCAPRAVRYKYFRSMSGVRKGLLVVCSWYQSPNRRNRTTIGGTPSVSHQYVGFVGLAMGGAVVDCMLPARSSAGLRFYNSNIRPSLGFQVTLLTRARAWLFLRTTRCSDHKGVKGPLRSTPGHGIFS